jgi:membrane protease YdiL (CAAX protease family)
LNFELPTAPLAHVLLGLGLWIALWLPIAIPLGRRLKWQPFHRAQVHQKLPLLVPLYLLAPVMLWVFVATQNLTWRETGLGNWRVMGRSLALGWAIAVLGLLAVTAVRWLGGWLRVAAETDPGVPPDTGRHGTTAGQQSAQTVVQRVGTALALVPLGLFLAGVEEWIFRGWMQSQLETGFAPWLAAAIASVIFAVAHLLWDGRSGLRQQPGLLLLGLVLVIARWQTGGQIGLAWGLHGGWIWGLACLDAALPLQPTSKGPQWWVGRPGQPLTGLLDGLLLAGTAGLLWLGWLG